MAETTDGLDALMAPRSVAIIGASDNPRRFGGKPIDYMKRGGFAGSIYPVNSRRSDVQGLRAWPTIEAIDDPVDCAVISVATDDVAAAVAACAAKGVRSAILFSPGFGEAGPDGKARQDELVRLARGSGMRLLGPNCMGAFNARTAFYGTFASAFEAGIPAPGRIGLVSQSGGYGGYVLSYLMRRGVQLGCWATTGNEADLELGGLLGWMAAAPDIDVLVAYMEGVRDGAALIAALALARANRKPVVVMKVGRTSAGRDAAASHTAALTGEDAVFDAVFEEYGALRARTTEELIELAYAASHTRYPAGRRVGVVSISGGIGVEITDHANDAGLDLPAVPEDVQAGLRALVLFCSPRNPIDMTGLVTTECGLLERTLDLTLGCGAFDTVLVFLGIAGLAPSMSGLLRDGIIAAQARRPDRLIVLCVAAGAGDVRAYRDAGVLVFEHVHHAVRAVAALAGLPAAFDAGAGAPAMSGDVPDWPDLHGPVNEWQAKQAIAGCGFRVPRERLARDAAEAMQAADDIGYPVAVKIASAAILHKTELGGVVLGLRDRDEVARCVAEMTGRIGRLHPDLPIDGVLVAEMVTGGIETIVGVHQDPSFGPVVTLGLGGVLTELAEDSVCRLAPVTEAGALAMARRLRFYPMLAGYRGGPGLDVAALAGAVSAVSRVAAAHRDRIASIEINPAVVLKPGEGVVALDAVVQTVS